MSKTEYIKAQMKITALGLSPYEAKAYLTLLLFNRLSAPELAEISGIPKTKIYQICEKLNEKGIIKIETELEKIYVANTPDEAIKNFIKWKSLQKTKEFIELNKLIKGIKNTQAVGKEPRTKNPLLSYYVGIEQIERKFLSLRKEKKDIILFISQRTSPLIKLAHFKNTKKIVCSKSVAEKIKTREKIDIVDSVPLDIVSVEDILYVLSSSDTFIILWEFLNPVILEFFQMGIDEIVKFKNLTQS